MHPENANISIPSDENCTEFVAKIAQIVLRNRIENGTAKNIGGRTRTKSDVFQPKTSSNHSRMHSDPGNSFGGETSLQKGIEISLRVTSGFWTEGTPIHIDILSNTGFLLERWIVAFQSRNSSLKSDYEPTDLILLTQSLYSEIRSLPLSNLLHISRKDLRYCLSSAEGEQVEHNSSCITKHQFSTDYSFHPQAQLSVSKFRSASTSTGTLFLRVVCDSSLSGFELPSRNIVLPTSALAKLSIYENETRSSAKEEFGSILSSGSFSPPNASPITNELPNRKSAGSPFPSPAMKKKVLKFTESRLSIPSNPKLYQSPTSPTRKSNLQFEFAKNSSYSSRDGCDIENGFDDTEGDGRLYSPDGIEILAPEAQARRGSVPPSEPYGTFVGSYEESILIGRLSTIPSKPLPFIAEIGVLATGKCKPQLKCPAHVSLPFPAYFYELDEDTPTPYVGIIDLDEIRPSFENFGVNDCSGYRLPFKGQLQIMIKNPSSTSIKVFLIPYDFRDMPAGTKTFLRQKSYANSPRSRDRLKFAIHITFQMTPKRRLYLTNQMRVVFSPRRLEMDERLKIQYSCPTFPKYSPLEPRKNSISSEPQGFSWLGNSDSSLSKRATIQDQGR